MFLPIRPRKISEVQLQSDCVGVSLWAQLLKVKYVVLICISVATSLDC